MRYTAYCACCAIAAGAILYAYVKHLEHGYRKGLNH